MSEDVIEMEAYDEAVQRALRAEARERYAETYCAEWKRRAEQAEAALKWIAEYSTDAKARFEAQTVLAPPEEKQP